MGGHYVALGDSISIDDYAGGPGRGAASLLQRNRDEDFPAWAGRDLASRGFDAEFLALDGATVEHVLARQLGLVSAPPTVATLTMGGNDLLEVYGRTGAALAAVRRVEVLGGQVLARLRELGGDGCRIVVGNVYDPSEGTGSLPGSGLPDWPEGPGLVAELNQVLAGLAQRHGAVLADLHAAFHGHGVTAGDPGQPSPRPAERNLWYCGAVEPNAWGAHAVREAWWEALESAG